FEDGGFALIFKSAIDDGELPTGGGLAGPDGVAASVEVKVFDDVSGFMNAGDGGAEMKIHVGEETVLRVVRANGDCAGVAVLDFDVDVGERGIKGAGVGVGDLTTARIFTVSSAAAAAGEEEHEFFICGVGEIWRVRGERDDGARCAASNHANSGPYI